MFAETNAAARSCGESHDASTMLRGRNSPTSCELYPEYDLKRRATLLELLLQQFEQASTAVDMMAEK